jgi:hypothetical protein
MRNYDDGESDEEHDDSGSLRTKGYSMGGRDKPVTEPPRRRRPTTTTVESIRAARIKAAGGTPPPTHEPTGLIEQLQASARHGINPRTGAWWPAWKPILTGGRAAWIKSKFTRGSLKAKAAGRLGGMVRSERKCRAAQSNGRLGGRPVHATEREMPR